MSDYYIGLSGLAAAQRAFDVIGNNIANSATEGYHRQRLDLSPAFSQQPGATTFIGGVNIEGISRMIDPLLEQEMLRQKSTLASISQETATLSTIQAAFGEFASTESGLDVTIDNFFTSLKNLEAHPTEDIWQNQVVSDAQRLTGQFRTMGEFLTEIQDQIKLQAQAAIETVNTLAGQIGELNGQIERIMLVGGEANAIRDQRDRLISQLSDLVSFQTIERGNGVTDINTMGIPLVTGSAASTIEINTVDEDTLGLSLVGGLYSVTNIQGGTIGGLFSLHNEIISGIIDNLDSLAVTIMQEVNSYHVMGIGSTGSFTYLSGQSLATDNLSEIGNIVDGTLYIRVTNTSTDEITREAISIDADTDTLSDIATAISAITGLTASVTSDHNLIISADANYTFDFMPCVLPEPTLVDFDDASAPTVTVTGVYEGTVNETLEFAVIGDGSVGNGTLQLKVTNGSGNIIMLNIGSGYIANADAENPNPESLLDIGNGIKIALSTGNLAESDGDSFQIDAFADSDTAGLLVATGLNTFFSGTSAGDMAVCSDIAENPQRIATAIGSEGTDHVNITRMADIKEKAIDRLEGLTCGEFYRRCTFDIGQDISIKQIQQENAEIMVLDLTDRRNSISGVDINEEAAHLLVFEQMFQAMAQYMNTINTSISSLMDIL